MLQKIINTCAMAPNSKRCRASSHCQHTTKSDTTSTFKLPTLRNLRSTQTTPRLQKGLNLLQQQRATKHMKKLGRIKGTCPIQRAFTLQLGILPKQFQGQGFTRKVHCSPEALKHIVANLHLHQGRLGKHLTQGPVVRKYITGQSNRFLTGGVQVQAARPIWEKQPIWKLQNDPQSFCSNLLNIKKCLNKEAG